MLCACFVLHFKYFTYSILAQLYLIFKIQSCMDLCVIHASFIPLLISCQCTKHAMDFCVHLHQVMLSPLCQHIIVFIDNYFPPFFAILRQWCLRHQWSHHLCSESRVSITINFAIVSDWCALCSSTCMCFSFHSFILRSCFLWQLENEFICQWSSAERLVGLHLNFSITSNSTLMLLNMVLKIIRVSDSIANAWEACLCAGYSYCLHWWSLHCVGGRHLFQTGWGGTFLCWSSAIDRDQAFWLGG